MSSPSNLYAEKVFSEHPMALWALDDKLDYVSLISEAQRNILTLWDETGCTLSAGTGLTGEPFPDSYTTKVSCSIPVGATNEAILKSPEIINFQDLDLELGTFCIGTHFYSGSVYLESVSIGYEYTDTTTSQVVQNLKTFNTSISNQWGFISETFEIPNESTNFKIVMKIITNTGGDNINDYEFYFNGISLGQWSEEFNVVSLGVFSQTFPAEIELTTNSKVIPAPAYGISSDTGYYLVNNNSLTAKNTGIPLVFGASNVTKLSPNIDGDPSFIFPGKGFLHENGRHSDYTVEFWTRINSDSYEPKRIFGPIASEDGLYVEGGFLTLLIGGRFSSHFVGEWFRPMLIHIRLITNNATVLINGEQVISLDFSTSDIPLPSITGEDWLGFYSYQEVNPVEIDCVAIYSYQVANVVAKRRYVYGQGVGSSESIDSAYSGTSAFVDYSFADYTANYNYPDFAQWQQGTFDNLSTTATALTTPQYSLPTVFTGTKTLQELYDDSDTLYQNLTSGDLGTDAHFISLNPDSTWNNDGAYINFGNFNVLNSQVASLYGVFQVNNQGSGTDEAEEVLFKIYNQSTGNYFSINVDGLEIVYSLYYSGVSQEIYRTDEFEVEELFAAGINIQTLVNTFGGNVATFFGNQNSLSLYVGGDNSGSKTFKGYIFSIGFSTSLNANSISSHFDENGIAIIDTYTGSGVELSENALALLSHTASYTLLPTYAYGSLFLDIGVSGYWEDYMPLSYFAQFVQNDVGNSFYDLDFLQFNIGYPSPSSLLESEETGSWTYEELASSYSLPTQRTYQQLDNALLTGWNNYQDLKEKALKYYEYNTQNAAIRSYVTFQYITEGANRSQDDFVTVVSAKENAVIDVSDYSSWATTKFEVVDNTIIYPRKDVDFNSLAIVYHLEFNIRGILTKPILLRKLELASQALNDNSFNPIGTRFGTDLFPYKRSGLYFDYKSKNPFSIYKGSTPYLYMNRTSGIQVRGDFDSNFDRGISIPINQSLAENYRVSAMQSWIRYDQESFTATSIPLFELRHKADTIVFFVVANDETGQRGRVYAKNKSTNLDFQGISYYVNGTLVREPVLTIKEWMALGINFGEALNFDLFRGFINLNSPALFNNVAYYQANNLQQLQSKINRPWLKVKQDGLTEREWSYWLNNFTWEGVLVISASALYGVNAQDVYKAYTGTNKIIIDDEEGMIFDADKMKIYNDTTWSVSVGSPV
jgi:hypothetical protein